ncbi:hypothetical protein SKAU_G00368500 [Synaphobranchus kaupii]|uniref:Uncharacterized protein n=1 Tax=Synaphobranchus kaupii TaxID=118154 RepID=A0A9Q1EFJ4_SYNKA|nr:hypothetical protein SKAU_G00368500 [Synaphobranchus kaupii]
MNGDSLARSRARGRALSLAASVTEESADSDSTESTVRPRALAPPIAPLSLFARVTEVSAESAVRRPLAYSLTSDRRSLRSVLPRAFPLILTARGKRAGAIVRLGKRFKVTRRLWV